MSISVHVTNKEVTFQPDEIIVSKTDLKGRIREEATTLNEQSQRLEKEVDYFLQEVAKVI